MDASIDESRPAIDRLVAVMARLRDPERGCAWDVQQDFQSIAPYTLEEAFEVVDAIARDDLDDLRDELGDLLLQVVFHARMGEEAGAFDFEQIADGIVQKMIRRHPHVFGDARFEDATAMKASWERIKAEERAEKRARRPTADPSGTLSVPSSALDGVARSLPALTRADKLQKRAARIGFDWPDATPVLAKLDEELGEFQAALSARDARAAAAELGDVLFTVVNLARHHGIDPESALRGSNDRFDRRFREVERLADARDQTLDVLDLEALDALWTEAKRTLER